MVVRQAGMGAELISFDHCKSRYKSMPTSAFLVQVAAAAFRHTQSFSPFIGPRKSALLNVSELILWPLDHNSGISGRHLEYSFPSSSWTESAQAVAHSTYRTVKSRQHCPESTRW